MDRPAIAQLKLALAFAILSLVAPIATAVAEVPSCACSSGTIPMCVAPAPASTATPVATPTQLAAQSVATPTCTPTALPTTSAPLVQDDFSGADGLITDYTYYSSASFPNGGTSKSTNPSQIWEGDSGSFYRRSGWGYSGRPIDWGNKYFFRFNTRSFALKDFTVAWGYRSSAFGKNGYAVEGSDAVDAWLRYQTQYNLYVWQFDRTNNCIQAKRKIPAQGWTGPSNLLSNKGVYYTLPTDAQQPIFGSGLYCISWEGVKSLLPASERTKPSYPNLAHDGATPYDFQATVKTLSGGLVQIQGYRAGELVYSATDDGRSGLAANGETQGTHRDRGYYNSVTGWQAAWALPITAAGSTGFRSDNVEFWLDSFVAVNQ